MRTCRRTSLVIWMVSLSVVLALLANLTLRLWESNPIPPGSSVTPTQSGTQVSSVPQTNGQDTTIPVLDGTLQGIDLQKIEDVLDDPCHQWHVPFLNAGWSEEQWGTAKWLIYRESRCTADAFNGVDAGLLQINEFHRPLVESFGLRFPEDMFDGETNLWVAYMLWLDYGWEPWIYEGVVPGE